MADWNCNTVHSSCALALGSEVNRAVRSRCQSAQIGRRTRIRAYRAIGVYCLSEKEVDSPELRIFTSDMTAVQEEGALRALSPSLAGGPFTATRGGGGGLT